MKSERNLKGERLSSDTEVHTFVLAEAVRQAIGFPAYIDPKKLVPKHAIVQGMLVKLLSEGLLSVGVDCAGYW